MATQGFDTPLPPARNRRNQDVANLILGIWLFVSPWVLQFATTTPTPAGAPSTVVVSGNAAWNAWVMGALIFLAALSAIRRRELWQEWITLLLGIWTFVAPWVLGFVPLTAASWDHWIVGALVFLVSVWNLAEQRRTPSSVEMAHAGNKPVRDR